MTPSEVGERAEATVIAALVHAGKCVFVPFGASGRCDLLFQDDARIHRVQVKTGVLRDDVVFFRTCSNTKNVPKDYRGDIDFFGVYCHETQSAYLVPVADVPIRAGHLRLRPPKNNQRKLIRWAGDYRLPWSPAQLVLERVAIEPVPDGESDVQQSCHKPALAVSEHVQ